MISKNLYNCLKTKRSISGVEKLLEQQNYTVLYPSGGDFKVWTNGVNTVTVKVEIDGDEEAINDYDVYINTIGSATTVFINKENVMDV